jgi:hypothetical protein
MAELMKSRLTLLTLVAIASSAFYAMSDAAASSINTYWEGLAHNISLAIESYSERNNGALPPNLDGLFTGANAALLEEELGGPISTKVIYLKENLPKLDDTKSSVVAVIAFPINEDRRKGVGRYIVYKNENGKIGSRWESEDVLQTSLARANIALPAASTYTERPLKPLSPEYSVKLIDDAVGRGVSMQEAVAAVEKHVNDVVDGRVKEAKTWAEVVSDQAPATPTHDTLPTSTPRQAPSASVHEAAHVESPSPSLPIILVSILVVVIVGVIVFMMRRKTP